MSSIQSCGGPAPGPCRFVDLDGPIIVNSETAVVLESLEDLFSGLTYGSCWKVDSKAPKLPKIHILWTSGHRRLVESTKHSKVLIYYERPAILYPSDNRKCPKSKIIICFWGPYNDDIVWFSISRKPLVV